MNKSYRTAIKRSTISAPTNYLLIHHKAKIGDDQTLDYGCGRGDDAKTCKWEKYDPHFFPKLDKRFKWNTIICNYVLNVVDEKTERKIIKEVKALLHNGGTAYFSVRRDKFKEGETTIGTFQRWSTPKLKSLYIRKGSFEIYYFTKK